MSGLRRAETRAANVLGRIGERFGAEWLTYSPLRMHLFHVMAKPYAAPFAESLAAVFPDARRLADVGAGSGVYAAACNQLGRPTIACERSASGRFLAHRQGVDCRRFNLTMRAPAIIPRHIDLAYSIEVAEHVPAELGDHLVKFLCASAPVVVFTAAPPGQGGTGHINEQPPSYWGERFERLHFTADRGSTDRLRAELLARANNCDVLAANIMVFCRG